MAATHDHGQVAELGPVPLLDRGVGGVAVEMSDGEILKFRVAKHTLRSTGRADPGIGGRPVAAIAADGLHGTMMRPGGCRAKADVAENCGLTNGGTVSLGSCARLVAHESPLGDGRCGVVRHRHPGETRSRRAESRAAEPARKSSAGRLGALSPCSRARPVRLPRHPPRCRSPRSRRRQPYGGPSSRSLLRPSQKTTRQGTELNPSGSCVNQINTVISISYIISQRTQA